jgi:hypothetical protein
MRIVIAEDAAERRAGAGQLVACRSVPLRGRRCCPGRVNPIPACSGQVVCYRLNRGGDRQLNRALHTILLVRLRTDPDARAYLARRTAQGKSRRDAKRASGV